MIPKSFDDITKSDIDALPANQVREGREIEYKKELPAPGDDAKREFLADASSFANASGGDLIFGVEAKDGIPIAADGVPVSNPDQLTLQLESIVRDNLDPRLLGLRTKVVPGFAGGNSVVVMRIQRSWAAPHMVTFKGSSRFYTRNSAGKHQMDITEIRSAILLSEGVADRVRLFRERRIATILSEETPVAMAQRSCAVVHLIPLAEASLSLQGIASANWLKPIGGYVQTGRHNIDGFITYATLDPKCDGYCQLFRNGAVEAVDCDLAGSTDIALSRVEREVCSALREYLPMLDSFGVGFPIAFALTLLGVKGKGVPGDRQRPWRRFNTEYDRDNIYLPEVLIENSKVDVPQVVRPAYDALWQGVGFNASPSYEPNGKWKL